MIIKLIFAYNVNPEYIRLFNQNPMGTCLSSSFAKNITPEHIITKYGLYLSFWRINNNALIKYYGNKVSIYSLNTYQ